MRALAGRVGVSHVTVSRWLRTGARPQAAHCRQLARALGVEADYVLALCGYPAGQAAAPPPEDTFMLFWEAHRPPLDSRPTATATGPRP